MKPVGLVAVHRPLRPSTMEPANPSPTETADLLVDLLDTACQQMQMPLQRTAVRRDLATALTSAGPVSATACRQAILDSAAAAGIRADLLVANVDEAAEMSRAGAPLVLLRQTDSSAPTWLMIVDYRGGKLAVCSPEARDRPRWIRPAALARELGTDGSLRWLSMEGLYPCTPPKHDDLTPLARYLDLLKPERSDILVVVVLAIVIGLLTLSTPIAVEALVNTVAFGQLMQPVVVLALILFVFLGFSAAMRALQTYIVEIIQQRIFVRVSSDLAHRLPRVPREFWDSHHGPELINRFFDVVTVQKVTAQMLIDGFLLVLQALVGMTVIAFYHPLLLGFDVFLVVLVAGIVFVLGRRAVTTAIDESKSKYQTAAWLEELGRHPTAFRGRSQIRFAMDVADRHVTNYLINRRLHFRILLRQVIAALAVQAIASTVLLGLGGWLVIQGELTLGQLVAAELIVTVIIGSLAKIGKHVESYYDVAAAMDKLGHLFDMPIAMTEGIELQRRDAGVSVNASPLDAKDGQGRAVATPALRLLPGEAVALIGGPATARRLLLESIAGLRTPVAGHVELDGFDVRRLRHESVLDQVAYVGGVEVFAGTIAENVHLGRPEASEERIRFALSDVNLLDEILDLPDGLATPIDTEGLLLSPDQQVRLMLARALAGNPRMLLIDEVLDGLPDDQLSIVASNLLASASRRTCLISTGRRDVAALCERVVDLSNGSATRRRRDADLHDAGQEKL